MKRILTAFVYLLLCASGYAQEKYQNQKVVGAAPNTAALDKFTEYPVDIYTGLPQIGVPLYEIKLKGISVPVTLSYHSSGIQIDDVSSNVGMGWALSAGGSISIHKNGILDEISGYGLQHPEYQKVKNSGLQSGYTGSIVSCILLEAVEDKTELYSGGDIAYLRGIGRGQDDSEADMYSFNYGGRSGKFFEDQDGVFRTIPYSMLKIERVVQSGVVLGYTVTDETGIKYEFLLRETIYSSITNSCNPNALPEPGYSAWSRNYSLTKITTPFGETVRFYYSTTSNNRYNPATNSRAKFFSQTLCGSLNANGLGYYYQCGTASTTASYENFIDSIISSDHAGIYFSYSSATRKDLPGSKILSGITVKNRLNNETIKSYALTHDYYLSTSASSTNPDDFRLRLKQISSPEKPPYQFEYEEGVLPPRRSFAQDHYGYFNNKTNNQSLFILDEWNNFNDGGDRNVDTAVSRTGVLNKVIWPTGGFTKYFYESNDYWEPDTITKYNKHSEYTFASQSNQTTVGPTFTFPANGHRASVMVINTYDGSQIHNDYCIVHLYGPNGFHKQYLGTPSTPIEETLVPGSYHFEIENVGSTYYGEAGIFWFEEIKVQPHNEPGGGLRIKEIQAFTDPGKIAYQHKFEYLKPGTTQSSGKPMYRPLYYDIKQEDLIGPPNGCGCPALASCNMLIQHSSSILPLGFSNGNSVSYTDVTDYFVDKTKSGYTHSKFLSSNRNSVGGISQFPHVPQINYDWTNGLLKEKNEYKYEGGAYKQILKTENFYNYTEFDPAVHTNNLFTASSAKIALWVSPQYCDVCPPMDCNAQILGIPISNIAYGIANYKLYSSWHRLDKTILTSYENNIALTNTNELYYGSVNHIFPNKKITYDSKDRQLITRTTYPPDYTGITGTDEVSAGINSLKIAGITAAEIENTSSIADNNGANEKITGAGLSVYESTIPLPKKMRQVYITSPLTDFTPSAVTSGTVTIDSRYENAFEFKHASATGNILEKKKTSDAPSAYIWDYLQKYPVAEVTNAVNDDVAYCSFEAEGKGNWSFTGATAISSLAVTGTKIYSLSNGPISKMVNSSKAYIISFWKTGSVIISNATLYRTGKTINDLTYYEYEISNAETITINGTGFIDELRLYPKNAQMNSYTYKPLIGITSQSDMNGNILYYEYDTYGRLKTIRDMDGNVVKVIEYKYNAAVTD